jgi:hypothetical protein
MADKRPKGHNPSEKSLQRWDNEGGAIKGVRAKRPRDPNQLGKLVVDIATGAVEDRSPTPEARGKDPAAAELGRKGGEARAAKMTKAERRKAAQKAAKQRWSRQREPAD